MQGAERRTFYLQIIPRIGYVQIPKKFYDVYKYEVPTRVWFIDRVGTKIGIIIDKFDENGYFSHGILKVLDHYSTPEGAWLKLTYMELTDFAMKVKDVDSDEVAYPQPATVIDFVFQFIPRHFHDYMNHGNVIEPEMPRTWEIQLTHKQATRNNMNLPASLVRECLEWRVTPQIYIQDEEGEKWSCKIRWGRRGGEAKVGGQWSLFCAVNGLRGGSQIVLQADQTESTLFHARVATR